MRCRIEIEMRINTAQHVKFFLSVIVLHALPRIDPKIGLFRQSRPQSSNIIKGFPLADDTDTVADARISQFSAFRRETWNRRLRRVVGGPQGGCLAVAVSQRLDGEGEIRLRGDTPHIGQMAQTAHGLLIMAVDHPLAPWCKEDADLLGS